ncbi:MAG: ABC transporter ATP-binding protein [Acidimicrobiales bacterium]
MRTDADRDDAAPVTAAVDPGDGTRLGRRGPAVVCTDLVVRYGARTAVDAVSFDAERGEVVCVLGPNGAGLTSTIECLEGYRRAAGGSLRVLGMDPWADHRAVVGRIGVMLQRGGVYPMLAPRHALRLFASYYPRPQDPEALLDLVRLREVARTPWRHLSGGEQARLSLALALVGRPEVVFLDEPTAGVDPEGRLSVRDVITDLRDQGACVVLTTHEMTEAERVADRVVILHHGRVVAEGSPAGLAGGVEVSFGAPPGLEVSSLAAALGPDASVVEEGPGRYRASRAVTSGGGGGGGGAEADAAVIAATVTSWLAERAVTLRELRVGRSLEETYLAVVGAGADSEVEAGAGTGPGAGDGTGRDRGRWRSRAGRRTRGSAR